MFVGDWTVKPMPQSPLSFFDQVVGFNIIETVSEGSGRLRCASVVGAS